MEIPGGSLPLLPTRERPEVFSITIGKSVAPVILVSSLEKDIPLFWRAEIFTQQGRVCDEALYAQLWQLKCSNELAYFSFDTEKRPLQLRAQGRLLEIMLYTLFFEADARLTEKLLKSLRSQAVRETVANQWQELMSPVAVDLETGRKSLRSQLAENYNSVAEILKFLTPKTIGFRRLFGL